MRRVEYVCRRLDAWADWQARQADGGRRGGSVVSSIYLGRERVACANQGDRSYLMGLAHDIEAAQIDALLVRLGQVDSAAQQALILVHWRGRRDSMAFNARRIGITRQALHERCCRGDALLDRWIAQEQADRVARISATARA